MIRYGWIGAACCAIAMGCSSKDATTPQGGAANSSNPTGPAVDVQPDGGAWKPLKSPEGRFSVLLPGEATKLPDKEGEVSYGVELESGGGYTVMFAELDEVKPEEIEQKLTNARNDMVGKDKVVHDETLKVAGHPARDFAFVDADGDVNYYRLIIVGNRLYQLVTVTAESKFADTKPDRQRFLDSFELVE